MTATTDSALRAMTDDSAFRVMAVNTTQTVRDALERQAPNAVTRKTFGDLITGANLENIDPWIEVAPEGIVAVCTYLRDEPSLAQIAYRPPTGRDTGLPAR